MQTIADVATATQFFFKTPLIAEQDLHNELGDAYAKLPHIIAKHVDLVDMPMQFMQAVKAEAQEHKVSNKALFTYLRLKLTGATKGPQLHDIIALIGAPEAKKRLA